MTGHLFGGGKDVDVDGHALDVEGEDAEGCVGGLLGSRGEVVDVDGALEVAPRLLLPEASERGVANVDPATADDVLVDEEAYNWLDVGFVEFATFQGGSGFLRLLPDPPGTVLEEERVLDLNFNKRLFVRMVPDDGATLHDGALFDDAPRPFVE